MSGSRERAKDWALREGAEVQLTVLRRTAEVADLAAELAASGLSTAVGDSATAVFLTGGAARARTGPCAAISTAPKRRLKRVGG